MAVYWQSKSNGANMGPYQLQTGDDLSVIAVGMTLEEVEAANPNMPIKNWWRRTILWNEAGAVVWIATGGDVTVDSLYVADGTALAPSLAFTSDTDTGMYRAGTNQLGFTAGSTQVLQLATTDVDVTTGHLNVISNTGSPTITLGEWSVGYDYATIETDTGYLILGNGTGNDESIYLRTKSTGAIYLGANGGNNLTVANSGNVGIGTTAPNKALDVVSSGTTELSIRSTDSVGDSALLFGNVDDTYQASIFYDASVQSLKLKGYNNTTRLTIASSGNVGIGTTSPAVTLHVQKDVDAFVMKVENDGDSTASDGLWVDTRWNTSTNTPFKVTSNSGAASLMTIKGDGKVGIGTASPTQPLHVNGDALISGQLNCSHLRGDETTQYFGPSTSWEMYLNTAGLYPYTNSGVALGSTSRYWNGVYSSDWFRSSGATGWYNETYSVGLYATQTGWITTYPATGFISNTTAILLAPGNTTTTSGSLYIRRESTYGSLQTYSSTRELKENVQSINPAESGRIIDMLRPVTYIEKYRSGPDGSFVEGIPDNSAETADQYKLREWDIEYGFIAEELDALEPEGVKLASYDWQQIDEEGFPKPNGWKDSNITAILVAEVKELRKRLAVLEEVQ